MHSYTGTALVTLLALALYFLFSLRVGRGREVHGIEAPSVTGHPDFERLYRVQMNTLEWLPLFLPALWLCALYLDDRLAAALGLLWIAGRILYARGYAQAANRRGPGFAVQEAATIMLWLAALGGIIASLMR